MSSVSEVNGSPSNSPPSLQATAQEAAADYLPKLAKIQTGARAVFLRDLSEMSAQELDAVRRYREKTVFGQTNPPPGKEAEAVGDIIVCDDYHVQIGQQPAAAPAAAPSPQAPAAPAAAVSAASPVASWAKKLATAAALMAGGGGLGAGVPWLLGAFNQNPPAAVAPAIPANQVQLGVQYEGPK